MYFMMRQFQILLLLFIIKQITDTQQGQQYIVHTRGVKAGRSLLGNGKEIDFCIFILFLN